MATQEDEQMDDAAIIGRESLLALAQNIKGPSLFNKTWILYKTTPFYGFNHVDCGIYQTELHAHIGANARDFTSGATAGGGGIDARFPSQIDGDGHNIIETLDDLGDVKKIEFQFLDLDNNNNNNNENAGDRGIDEDQPLLSSSSSPSSRQQESILVTITVRPKDFTYYSTILLKAPVVIGQVVLQ
ncbi:hypothetical protein BG004_003350, partial [Podila humilis]